MDAGATATSYLLAGPRGSGVPPVVLLTPLDEADVARGALALAVRFRVIAACPPFAGGPATRAGRATSPAFSTWLREFLDGLGVARASVVAEGPFALPALSFALSDPGRVERLALVSRDAPDPLLPDAALVDRLGQSGRPILVLRAGAAGSAPRREAEVADLIRFLAGEADPAER